MFVKSLHASKDVGIFLAFMKKACYNISTKGKGLYYDKK